MKRTLLMLPLLLMPQLPACNGRTTSHGTGIRELVARGTGQVYLTESIGYRELATDGVRERYFDIEMLQFDKGVVKTSPGGIRGSATISVTDDGWVTLRQGKNTTIVPPTKLKYIQGTVP